jgi:hypothetical protein
MPTTVAPGALAPAVDPTRATKALGHVLSIAAIVLVVVTVVVLFVFDGWHYYRAPLGARGYLPSHRLLRPSGPVGLALGVGGVIAMLSTLPYAVRKRWRALAKLGSLKGWLEFHIFCGVVGPVLVTFHTSFRFNGLISAGYWLMVAVWASGFVGRYLYVRIPKTIRGQELSRADIEAQLDEVRRRVRSMPLPSTVQRELDSFEHRVMPGTGASAGLVDLFLGELRVRLRIALLRRHLRATGMDPRDLLLAVTLVSERAAVTRKLAHLHRTRRLFELWHVFHRPLVYAMFAIVALHVAIAMYLGYARVLS